MTRLTIDALSLSSWQACKRQFLLHHDWRVLQRRPKALFDLCLRRAIVALSAGDDPSSIVHDAHAAFLESAANPGLDLAPGANPYRIAKDYCAMLSTIITSLSRLTLLTLHDPAPVAINSWADWRLLSFADESGTLHRWVTVDSWGEDDLVRELHSWRTIGDLIFARVPMILHVIEIGQQRNGRRSSPWARAWQHPTMQNLKLRFQKTDGSSLRGWTAHYLADHPQTDIRAWVDQMWKENVAQGLVHLFNVDCPTDERCDQARAQVMYEAIHIREAIEDRGMVPWSSHPMARNVCDGWGAPCPFQSACYTPGEVVIQDIGLYQSRLEKQADRGSTRPLLRKLV